MIVDNRPGANTIIGTDLLAKAAPDGYTLGWLGGAFFSLPSLFSNLPFDVYKDFVGVTTFGKTRIVLVLHPSVPANNLQEFIALVKSKPGEFNFASSGVGTNVHLSGELFNQLTGTTAEFESPFTSSPNTTQPTVALDGELVIELVQPRHECINYGVEREILDA